MEEFAGSDRLYTQETEIHARELGKILKQKKIKRTKPNQNVPLNNHFPPFHHVLTKNSKLSL